MRVSLLLLLSTVLLVASCRKSNEAPISGTSAETVKSPAYKKGPKAKTISGSMVYNVNPNFDLPCDCGSLFPVGTFYGTGNISHLGAATSLIKPCFAPIISGGVQIGNHVGAECATFTAANGDILYCYTYPYDLMFTPMGAVGSILV